MKVYVLTKGWNWEGKEVVDVYATEELAKAAEITLNADQPRCHDYTKITAYEVEGADLDG